MERRRSGLSTICFAVLLVVGVGFLFIGLVVIPVLPYFQLDAVLTPAELADESKKEVTLAMLKRAAGNAWVLWSGAGLVVGTVSALGLWAARGASEPGGRRPCTLGPAASDVACPPAEGYTR